jgi:hypothetical protein
MKANKQHCRLCNSFKDEECTIGKQTDDLGCCSLFSNRVIARILTGGIV